MYFFDVSIFVSQLLPPTWRGGKLLYLKSCLKPISNMLNEFTEFRVSTRKKINITPQVIIIEDQLKQITGISYGIYISDSVTIQNHFFVKIPQSAIGYNNEITVFLKRMIPAGRKYEIQYY